MGRIGPAVLLVLALLGGCSRPPANTRQYELRGQVLAVNPERRELLIKHEDIKGFMPGMTMPFRVDDPALLSGIAPGDLVTATLVVADVDAHLSRVTKTGHAALDTPPPPPAPDVLAPGEPVSGAPLVDQTGSPFSPSSLQGHRWALTFMYTRCPLPDFCPLMDRHFKAVQEEVRRRPDLADVRLVTVTLDPEYDTPAVLADHATRLQADPRVWSFVTGTPEAVAQFSEQFGIYVERGARPIDLTHNLRTAVIDASGRLVRIHTGNSWTPAELVADLETTPAPAR